MSSTLNRTKLFVSLASLMSIALVGTLFLLHTKKQKLMVELDLSDEITRSILASDTSRLLEIKKQLTHPYRIDSVDFWLKRKSAAAALAVGQVENSHRKNLKNELIFYDQITLYVLGLWVFILLTALYIHVTLLRKQLFMPLYQFHDDLKRFLQGRSHLKPPQVINTEIGQLLQSFYQWTDNLTHHLRDLHRLDRAKSDFLSIASHELRTPLTSIKGSLSLVSGEFVGSLDNETKNLINIAEQETDRLIRLINDLLDLAKIEAQRLPMKKDWILLADIINTTVDSMRGLTETNKVQFCVGQMPEVEIFADRDRIQQVLTNLLSNAVKFSPERGHVYIDVEIQPSGQLEICVRDEGIGISPEDQEIIFEKFRQAEQLQQAHVKGTGLGLAIAKAIMEEHNGDIGVRSKPGDGSTFYFILPQWQMKNNIALVSSREDAAA